MWECGIIAPHIIAVGPVNQRDEELVEPMLKQFPCVRSRAGGPWQ